MKDAPFLPVKYDIVFRLFFADERNLEFLQSLLKSILRLPEDEYDHLEIVDPHLLRDVVDDKLAILDIKLYTKSRGIIHIEIQLQVTKEFVKRILYYDAKLISEQVKDGENYDKIRQVISILITDDKFIKQSSRYHHRFTLYDADAGVEFTDLLEVHSVELPKLPEDVDGTKLYDWACFIRADTEEELDNISKRNPEIERAANKLREISADKEARKLYERRLKALRDKAMFEREAENRGREEGREEGLQEGRQEGRQEGVQNTLLALTLLKQSKSVEEIKTATGLSQTEIEELRSAL